MRSGGSRSSGRSAPAAAPPRAAAPQQRSGGMMSGLGSTMMQGMAFGAGSEVAHRAIGGLMGGSGGHQQAPPAQEQGQYQEQAQYGAPPQ